MAVGPTVVVPPSGSTQAKLVKTQLTGGVSSVTVWEPGTISLKVWLPVPPAVVIWKVAGRPPVPLVVKANVSSPPTAVLLMIIVPRLVLVYVQVTVSPGSRSIVAAGPTVVVPLSGSTQAKLVKSQPAGGVCSVTV